MFPVFSLVFSPVIADFPPVLANVLQVLAGLLCVNIPSESFRGILLQRKAQGKPKFLLWMSSTFLTGFFLVCSCGVVRSSCCDLARFSARFCEISSHRPHLRTEGPSDERRSRP